MSKKFKKSLILAASSASTLPFIAFTVACSTNEHKRKPNPLVAKVELNENLQLTKEEAASAPRVALITDGGDLFDKSFNQSGWEGIIRYGEQSGLSLDKYDVYEVKDNNFTDQYIAAINSGAKILVLPGFHHESVLGKFYEDNKQLVDSKGIKFIGLDFVIPSNIPAGSGISLLFETKEAGFLAGYAVGEYLKDKPASERTAGTFGGGTFNGVTDFNEGFYKGLYKYNSQADSNNTIQTKYIVDGNVYLGSVFDTTDSTKQAEVNKVINLGANVLLPVAGPWTTWVADQQNTKLVIGVDVDQSIVDTKNSSKYFTSITKQIAQAVYETVAALVKGESSFLGNYEDGKANAVIKKGIDAKWVGLAPSKVADKEKANAAIAKAFEAFHALTTEEKAWLVGKKVKPSDTNDVESNQDRLTQLSAAVNEAKKPNVETTPVTVPATGTTSGSTSSEEKEKEVETAAQTGDKETTESTDKTTGTESTTGATGTSSSSETTTTTGTESGAETSTQNPPASEATTTNTSEETSSAPAESSTTASPESTSSPSSPASPESSN
ncbi:BMP family ABC transporter substrate-binding protein [Mycoplasmopsis columbina]|uniref:BMP family ABC transporter substrate-binding protein n=1 Tax=Mycoplasmopsis columbina TaxID=114881 RepID=UPI00068F0F51|nr:BMP family ABC transporter substrate-binding protein [Mycoplasmopsis columbina]VEU77116.1 Uncharacterised protein [Mycoplasmopsis columbina]